ITDRNFRHFLIRPLNDEAIETYCRLWAAVRFRQRNDGESLSEALVQRVLKESSPAVRELIKNPLLLKVICGLAAPFDDRSLTSLLALPGSRAGVYLKAIRSMTERWKKAYGPTAKRNFLLKKLLIPDMMLTVLSHVALNMHDKEMLGMVTEE